MEDFTQMKNPWFLYRAELESPFPEWVANAPLPEREDFSKQASTAFADPENRLLPISTKEAAFHSAIEVFARCEEYSDDAFDRVKQACEYYGIEDDVLPYAEIFLEEIEKSAALDEPAEGRYAIDTELGGQNLRLLPLNDYEDVRESARELSKMAAEKRINLLMLVPAAREIVKAAGEHGVETLPETIVRFGYLRHADAEKSAALIEGREQYCKDPDLREVVKQDYQEAIAGVEDDPDDAMEKIAATDLVAGLRQELNIRSVIPNPYDVVFTGPLDIEVEKAASENILVRDVLIPLAAVSSIEKLDAEFRLSKSAAENFEKLRDCTDAKDWSIAIEQWEPDDQRTLLRMAAEAA